MADKQNNQKMVPQLFTMYPKTPAAQLKFKAVSAGDVVWLPGGFDFLDGSFNSFGRRCIVVGMVRGSYPGIVLKDCKSNQELKTTCLITKQDIQKTLNQHAPAEQAAYLARFTVEEGDLAFSEPPPEPQPKKKVASSMSKKELLAKLEALEAQVAALANAKE